MSNKRVLSFLVACSMIFSVVMPTTSVLATENNENLDTTIEEASDDLENNRVDALLDNGTTTVTILGTTDLHGRFLSYDYATGEETDGGLDKVATIVKSEREIDENLLLVDNGDAVQGNYNHLFVGGQNPMITAFNQIGYDSFSFGNHEFNQGLGEIENFMTNGTTGSDLSFLCANLYKDGERVYNPYVIKESNGVKVAIIGVVAPNITNWDAVHLEGYDSTNPAKEVGKVIEEIKADKGGADLYFVTAHVGLENEYGNGDSAIDIANENPEVSGIIAGHSHTLVESLNVDNAVISQPKNNGDYVSKFVFTFEKDGDSYKVIDKTATAISSANVEEDEDLKKTLSSYHTKALNDANKAIGTLDNDLAEANEVNGIPQSAVEDQGITDFINKVQLYYSENSLKQLENYDEDAYHVSGSALLDSESNLKAGDITKANIASIYKYDNKLYTIKTTGKQLKKYLEWTANFFNTYKDGDLTVSFNENVRFYNYDMLDGVKYDINISKEAGNRIENLVFERDNKEVSDEDIVYLTVNDYRYNSVLSSTVFDKGEYEKILDSNNDEISDVRDMIADYIENVANGKITREVDGNWKLTGISWNEKQRALAVEAINSGKLSLPTSQDGRTPNVKAITWDDVKKALGITDDETTDSEETPKKVIDILNITDLHGNIIENGKNIGAAKLAAEVKRLMNENSNSIFVGGGDLYQGTAIS
ncbi:MAG: 5'-nucleotidase C-terminal domain-containing protein, partial [Clostridium perfringens]|nr:5'-nucleotidase C-terminal domain-containing protein [Clostridium perfringens]